MIKEKKLIINIERNLRSVNIVGYTNKTQASGSKVVNLSYYCFNAAR